jgi:hypothetical protein
MLNRLNCAVMLAAIAIISAPAGVAIGTQTPPFTISKETTAITAPLRDDGSVDYVAALNQRFGQGVTPENNGFVLWLRVMGTRGTPQSTRKQTLALCGVPEQTNLGPGWKDFTGKTPLDEQPMRMWKAQDYPAYAAYLARQEDVLAFAAQAASKPQWWAPSVSLDGTVMQILLPELNPLRGVSLTLCGRALLRAQQGDFDAFLADVMTVKRLGRRASGWTIIGHLVANGIDDLADQAIGATAGAGVFSSEQCAKLAKALDGVEPMPPLWQATDVGERWSMLDWTESIAMGKLGVLDDRNAQSREWARPFKELDRDSVDWNVVLQRLNGVSDEVTAIMKTPSVKDEQIARQIFDWKMEKIRANLQAHPSLAKEAEETNQAYTQRVADAILSAISPSLWRAQDTCRRGSMREIMARAVVAAAQYRADKGNWPDKLQDLVPAYLPQMPLEMFSAADTDPIQYQRTDLGILLRARGPKLGDTQPDITEGSGPDTQVEGP